MRKNASGEPSLSTLGEYRDFCYALGPNSKAVQFLDRKIQESPGGRDEEVVAPDSQMRALLFPMLLEPAEQEQTGEQPHPVG